MYNILSTAIVSTKNFALLAQVKQIFEYFTLRKINVA